jgi:hypothetical protein
MLPYNCNDNRKLQVALKVTCQEVQSSEDHTQSPLGHPLLVAFEKFDHTYHIGTCILNGPAAEKMIGLKKWRVNHIGRRQAIAMYLLGKTAYIAVGTLGVSVAPRNVQRQNIPLTGRQPPNDLEVQTLHETVFEELVRNEALTRGYARPSALVDSEDMFVRVLPSFRETPDNGVATTSERHALVVALEVDRCRVSIFILITALSGIIVGASIGIAKGDVGLGAEVGGAVFTLATVLQGTMILMYK